jgi:DNA repair exonuclease SbcCD ATPase subunit
VEGTPVNFTERLADLNAARRAVEVERTALEATNERLVDLTHAQQVAQQVAEGIQRRAHERIAKLVTQSLSAVFEDPYELHILFEQRRGKTEARLVFRRRGHDVDPLTEAGGGVLDVAAFALRAACLLITRPPQRRLLVLDEPFRFVAPHLYPRVAALLQRLVTDLGLQLLISTHDPELAPSAAILALE